MRYLYANLFSLLSVTLRSLRTNIAGNTIAMLAAGLVPMTAMIGSGVDISRAYMVQTRLQQACDAGVLAGRRAVGDGTFDEAARIVAEDYFSVNFPDGYMSSNNVSFVPNAGDGDSTVLGTASVDLPTVVMSVFTVDSLDIEVTCQAQLEIANSDITLVLDTTGSMSCPENADTTQCRTFLDTGDRQGLSATSRIEALQASIDSFYNIVQGAADGSNARVRYAFVPYSQTVNVGGLLNPEWIADSHTYQTANQIFVNFLGVFTSRTESNCDGTVTLSNGNVVQAVWEDRGSGPACSAYDDLQVRMEPRIIDVSGYKTTLPVNGVASGTVEDPTNLSGGPYSWEGCIEERSTVASDAVAYNDGTGISPTGLTDLDIDTVPFDDATRWKPYWPEIIFERGFNDPLDSEVNGVLFPYTRASTFVSARDVSSACPPAAALLSEYPTLELLQDYTNTLQPRGNTYHDLGLIWGARLSSPQGLFQVNVNDEPANQGFVGRHLIFMTDGELAPFYRTYTAYGVEQHDARVTGSSTSTDPVFYETELDARHRLRYLAVCEAVKAKDIRLWVIAFNTALTTDLTDCASPNSSFTANNATELNDAFSSIAEQIAELRLVG